MHLCRGSFGEFPLFAWVVLWWLLFALSRVLRVSFVCSLSLVHVFRGACELGVLFSLSHEFRVSFVCSLALVHVFRGSLWVFCSCAGGVEPLCLFLRSRRLTCVFACPWSVLSPLCLFLRDHAFLSPLCWVVAHVFGDRDIALAFVVSLMPSYLVLSSCVVFFHLDELFVLCPLKPFLCAHMLSICSSRGRNLENQVDMNLDSWLDGDEWLTSVLVRVLWHFVLSILVWWLLWIACW
jgi:hypothetical protein